MNILLHCDEYYPRHVPIAIRMNVISEIFQKDGHVVQILTGAESLDGGEKAEENAIYCPIIPLKKKSSLFRMFNQLSFGVTSFFKSFHTGKTDVVLTSSPPILIGPFAWLIARIKHAVLVYDVRDIWPDVALEMGSFSEESFYCKAFRIIANFMYCHADIITTVSPGKVSALRAKLPEEQRKKVWLVENGLDERFLQQVEDPQVVQKYFQDDRCSIVYIGNIGLAQGLEHLIDLAEKMDPDVFQVLLFGDGAQRAKLEQMCTDKKLKHIHFCGRVDERTVYTVLKNATAAYIPLVNSNLKNSIPTKTYEALGTGCPVLMVADGDAAELIRESGFGSVISPDDVEKLPDVFVAFMKNYRSFATRKDQARQYILEHHSRQKITRDFEKKLMVYVEERK